MIRQYDGNGCGATVTPVRVEVGSKSGEEGLIPGQEVKRLSAGDVIKSTDL